MSKTRCSDKRSANSSLVGSASFDNVSVRRGLTNEHTPCVRKTTSEAALPVTSKLQGRHSPQGRLRVKWVVQPRCAEVPVRQTARARDSVSASAFATDSRGSRPGGSTYYRNFLRGKRLAASCVASPQIADLGAGTGQRIQRHARGASLGSLCRYNSQTGVALEVGPQGPPWALGKSMFMCPAVHMLTRISLRPSSTHEPSDPPFRVIIWLVLFPELRAHETLHRLTARRPQGMSLAEKRNLRMGRRSTANLPDNQRCSTVVDSIKSLMGLDRQPEPSGPGAGQAPQ